MATTQLMIHGRKGKSFFYLLRIQVAGTIVILTCKVIDLSFEHWPLLITSHKKEQASVTDYVPTETEKVHWLLNFQRESCNTGKKKVTMKTSITAMHKCILHPSAHTRPILSWIVLTSCTILVSQPCVTSLLCIVQLWKSEDTSVVTLPCGVSSLWSSAHLGICSLGAQTSTPGQLRQHCVHVPTMHLLRQESGKRGTKEAKKKAREIERARRVPTLVCYAQVIGWEKSKDGVERWGYCPWRLCRLNTGSLDASPNGLRRHANTNMDSGIGSNKGWWKLVRGSCSLCWKPLGLTDFASSIPRFSKIERYRRR